jgi:hypothetical protein
MARFLIEVAHDNAPDAVACSQVIQIFQRTGSHWVTHADWGCKDGNHRAWLVLEADTKDEARFAVPVQFREEARITRLTKFTTEDIDNFLAKHGH